MTIEIWGRRRHGKTKIMVALGLYFKYILGLELYSNMSELIEKGITKELTKKNLTELKHAVVLWDEFWREMDSQDWKNPQSRLMTHWWQLQGHSDLIFLYTTQLRSQMNNRIRESNDYSICCEKKKIDEENYIFNYTLYDGISFEKLKKWQTTTEREKFLYEIYNFVGNPKVILT